MGDENCIPKDRASRSRSKTPFLRSSCDRELCKSAGGSVHSGSHHFQVQYQKSFTAVAESHDERKKKTFSLKYSDTVLGSASVTGGVKFTKKGKSGSPDFATSQRKLTNLCQVNGVYRNSKERDVTPPSVTTVSRTIVDGRTSDYSSEESEYIQQKERRAFQLYKDTGDWWNVFPKTDYTYSEYSTHRREIAPGVLNMPNMSRLGLRSQDSPSARHDYVQQNLKNVGAHSHDRIRYSSSYSRTTGDLRNEKWARVFGEEYAANQTLQRDHSFLHVTRAKITNIFASLFYFMSSMISWSNRSVLSFWNNINNRERNYVHTPTGSFRAMVLQWIYCLLGYVKFVDTWLLMGWSLFSLSSQSYTTYGNRSHSLWTKLLKIFILLSPTLLLAGCWAITQLWDDQGVSNSVSIPEPNQPLLTSNSKITSDNMNQDFGTYSILKILSGSFVSSLHTLWIWILYPWVLYNQTSKVMATTSETHIPISIVDSINSGRVVAEECSQTKINVDELASKVISNPLFVNILSATNSEPVEAKMKIELDNILSKINMLQQYQLDQKSQSVSQLEDIKNTIKTEITVSLDEITRANKDVEAKIIDKISKLSDEQRSQLSQLKQMTIDIDGFVTQARFLKQLIQEESTLRESSILGLSEDLLKWKEQYSGQSSMVFSTHNCDNSDFSEAKMKRIVDDALMIYDADKTGKADFALESSGGSIISTRCTETYHAKTAVLSLFKYSLWYMSNNPRTIIQPNVHPGECWAFKGSQGYVVIKLSQKIHVTMFILEHIPKVLSPLGTIDSAPRNFSVWGLNDEIDTEGLLIGEYSYDQNGPSLQYFSVEKPHLPPYQFIELRVESNHGNLEYTCIYRFRVHGVVHQEQSENQIKD